MSRIIGIDLGTTNSEIALLDEQQHPQIIPIDNEKLMPSCVGLDIDGKLLVGRPARNQMTVRPEQTILSVKRLMGQETPVLLGSRSYSPEEISALILKKLKATAEQELGEQISAAVITVPAYFNDHQRKATRAAGELAGFTVKRIINEPTAAALAYGLFRQENQTILVYDLGGGTFDVSLIEVVNGVVEVKASHGDTQLGGDDFDDLLCHHVAEGFRQQYKTDLMATPRTRNRLKQAVEKAKKELSDQPFTTLREEFIDGKHHLEIEISRDEYEAMIELLLQRTIECIHQCLRDAAYLPSALDRIILVGGSSRTPRVRSLLEETFALPIHDEIDPDLIVALGAAIQGGIISGQQDSTILVDITPHTFGTSAVGHHQGDYCDGIFVPVIKRNTPLPTHKSEVFYTMHDNQEAVEIEIFQGEAPMARDNLLLGKFMVEGLRQVEANNPIILDLKLDLDGILEVTAREKISGLSRSIRIQTQDGVRAFDYAESLARIEALSDSTPEQMNADTTLEREIPETGNGTHSQLLEKARNLRRRAEKLLPEIGSEDQEEIENLLTRIRASLKEKEWEQLEEQCESLEDLLFFLED